LPAYEPHNSYKNERNMINPDIKSYPSLKKLLRVCLEQNIPFASYRLPRQPVIVTLVQHLSYPEKIDLMDHPETKSGFIMAPFFETANHESFLLEPDNLFISDQIDSGFIKMLSGEPGMLFPEKPIGKELITTPSEDFILQVNEAKKDIATGKIHKVVLSKVRVADLSKNFEAGTFFLHLCEKYPHAFVSIVQLPEVGCWIGATPEPLLVIEKGKVNTVSLAGTQIATNAELNSYGWSEKEIEEQGIVTGFVENTLQSLKIEKYNKTGPVNYKAANLIHLKTNFEFDEIELGNRLGECLKALHPTPSVGGLPKEAARKFILKHEKHDRSYYSGFLGPLNINYKSNLFVNLRCLQLFKKQFVLYSGAGITASSIAENEWEETENKMLTMMNAMETPSKR
jgi:isochorismate synthase